MGLTAYGAILNEYSPSLRNDMEEDSALPIDHFTISTGTEVAIDTATLEIAVKVLSLLPSKEVSKKIILTYYEKTIWSGIHMPTLYHFHESFWAKNEVLLEKPRKRENLILCAKTLCSAAKQTTFPGSYATSLEYLESLTTRWEMVGVLFSAYSVIMYLLSCSNNVTESLFPEDISQADYTRTLLEAAGDCLRIVDKLDTGLNVMVSFLAFRCSVLQDYLGESGDSNQFYWRRNIVLCANISALGLHRINEPVPGQPYSLLFVEHQKRMFVAAFVNDKQLSVFQGQSILCDVSSPLRIYT